MITLKSWLASSQDPTQVSNTVKGIVLGASSLIVLIGSQLFHIQLTADNVATLATEVGTLAGVIWFFYGLIFKGVMVAGSIKR